MQTGLSGAVCDSSQIGNGHFQRAIQRFDKSDQRRVDIIKTSHCFLIHHIPEISRITEFEGRDNWRCQQEIKPPSLAQKERGILD